jgi:mono/diheme cytochrome c family protein
MAIQKRFQPEGETTFFADHRMMREPVGDTLPINASLDVTDTPPAEAMSSEELKHGRERFEIHCAPCHDRTGSGEGMVVQRGFQKPKALFSVEIEQLSDQALYKDITDGHGTMAGYRNMILREDRWAIVAYLRALQLAHGVPISFLDQKDLAALKESVK